MKNNFFTKRRLLISALALTGIGLTMQFLFRQVVAMQADYSEFIAVLYQQMDIADEIADEGWPEEGIEKETRKNDISLAFYFYEKGNLNYWTTSAFSFQFPELNNPTGWNYEHAANVEALFKWYQLSDTTGVLALLPLKSSFPYENLYLKNKLFAPFDRFGEIEFFEHKTPDTQTVNDRKKNYIFSVSGADRLIDSGIYNWIIFIVFALAFLLYIIVYLKTSLFSKQKFKQSTPIFIILLLVCCWFDFPDQFFRNPLFSPHSFTVNKILKSFTHLSAIVISGIAIIYSFARNYTYHKAKFVPITILAVYLYFFIEFLKSLILHSSISLNIYLLDELSFINLWAHFLIFLMITGIYVLLRMIFPVIITLKTTNSTLITGLLTLLSLGLTHHIFQEKQFTKYKILTENIRLNGTSRQDPVAELLMDELSEKLVTDSVIRHLINIPDSANTLVQHIETNHLPLFRNKYDVTTSVISTINEETRHFITMLHRTGFPVNAAGFYSLPSTMYEKSYIGIVPIDTINYPEWALLFEFQNKRNFRSYSFPDLLINDASVRTSEISVASYSSLQLMNSDYRFDWPESGEAFSSGNSNFHRLKINQSVYYILETGTQLIAVKELKTARQTDKIFYFILIVVLFSIAGRIFITLHLLLTGITNVNIGLTGKFQLVFIVLLMISFVSTLIFSVSYFRSNFEKEQILSNEQKKQYIKSSLQETFFWVNDINTISEQQLNTTLQELAYRYQTDIHIFNSKGELAGSSQTLIFSKQLTSKFISPEVLFAEEVPSHQYERIGQLSYLVSYSELLNGDYLSIGYIAVPRFFSQNEVNNSINQFLITLLQIYTLVLLLSIVLLVIAGNRLAEPLRMMEDKLKTMKLNGRNARIEYRGNDEIGQLVEQYNKTVDELENSTRLLLQSERENAWKTMARQVAHEINNPLTPMKLTIQQLQRLSVSDNIDQFNNYFPTATRTLIEQIDNLSRIAGTFSQFARLPETEFQQVDCVARLYSAASLFTTNRDDIELTYNGPQEGVVVNADPEQLLRVYNNLLKNALQAIPSSRAGKITIAVNSYAGMVQIDITDNGAGISRSDNENIFKPNFTTKSSGMGLGLSISKAIIENMGGSIYFTSEENKGTTFTVKIPVINQ